MALLTAKCLMLAAMLSLSSALCPAAGGENLEYEVKAAFLFNFLKFVEWPAVTNEASWVIGVLGPDPLGEALDNTVRGKVVNGRPVEVRRYTKPGDVKGCHILFIGRLETEQVGTPARPGLLTVGEAPGFLKAGGIINFYLEDNRVHFEISAPAAHSAGLHVSPQLLRLGKAL